MEEVLPAPAGPSNDPLTSVALRSVAWKCVTDAALAEGLQIADPGAQHEAWRRFFPVVRGMARRRLRSEAEVDDVVQEAFLALFKSIKLLREPVALRAFSLTITARILNRELLRRARAKLPVSEDDELHDGVASDEADPATRHAYAALRTLIRRLRIRERRAFMLRFVAGMSFPEVASALGVSIPTVRRVLSSAQDRIAVWASRDPFLSDYLELSSP